VTDDLADSPASVADVRRGAQRRARRRRTRRQRVAVLVLILLAPVLYSYVSTMLRPSSLPLGIRSVEWLRTHHGAWIVNNAERLYYNWNAPAKGGPTLHTLPIVGNARPPKNTLAQAYRPPRILPLVHPRLPGEGAWRSTGRTVKGGPPVLLTTFRSDPNYPRVVAYVAWFDHRRTQLALYPGRYEPPGANPRGPMQVPQRQRWRLLATFNSGFLFRDSRGGFFLNGDAVTPLREGQGTIVAYKNGRVDVVSWTGGAAPSHANVVLAQQNLPLIVSRGRPNPLLANGSLWGSTLGNAVRVWRSAVGVDRRGNLIYVAANDQTAASIADILIHVGAVRAIELDINAEWPSLIAYGRGGVGNATKVVPNTQQPTSRYLVPDDRDFFAIYRRTTTSALRHVPFG
jgi:Phosphodiester glycosidase